MLGRCGGFLTFVETQQLCYWYGWGSFQQQQQNAPERTPSGDSRVPYTQHLAHTTAWVPAGWAAYDGAAVSGLAQSTSHDDKFFPSDDCTACVGSLPPTSPGPGC